jgi:hypothetical protein
MADANVKRVSTDTHERLTADTSPSLYTESTGILPVFPWGVFMQSQGLHKNAGAHSRLPAAGELLTASATLYGKHGHPARLSLGRSYAKPRFA